MPAVPRSRHRRLDHRASHSPVWHLDTRQQPQGTRNRHTSARPHPPPYDSTPILIDRVRRTRQRLRSNGSIESDPAIHPPLSADTPARRVTLDRVLTLIRSNPVCRAGRARIIHGEPVGPRHRRPPRPIRDPLRPWGRRHGRSVSGTRHDGSIATSRSRSCPRRSRWTRNGSPDSNEKRNSSPRSTTRTSRSFTAWNKRTVPTPS